CNPARDRPELRAASPGDESRVARLSLIIEEAAVDLENDFEMSRKKCATLKKGVRTGESRPWQAVGR
ncbi:MAG: hypothetical protein WBL39_13580, partial [Terrimicrobiaceae bacterium]